MNRNFYVALGIFLSGIHTAIQRGNLMDILLFLVWITAPLFLISLCVYMAIGGGGNKHGLGE